MRCWICPIMNRYSVITEKFPREIVLLKGRPCQWGRCTFCDYILDNSLDESSNVAENRRVLRGVTGEFKTLEVINSGSVFELPQETLEDIRKTVESKRIEKLVFEAHWMYRHRLDEMRAFFNIPIFYKTGVETFDNDFRQRVLKKGASFNSPGEVAKYFDSPCLMIGVQGQSRLMIARDIEIIKELFKHATINIYHNNSTEIRRDDELVRWFLKEYAWLQSDPRFEVLLNTEDFGVTDGRVRN